MQITLGEVIVFVGCPSVGPAHCFIFSRKFRLLKTFTSSVAYMLHVCKVSPKHRYKKFNCCYERGACSGLKYFLKICKYLGMVKQ